METLLAWADILHDETTGAVILCQKFTSFYSLNLIKQSDEIGVFSQFWSFEEKVYFITWIWKLWKFVIKLVFVKTYFLITRNKHPNINISYKYANWMYFLLIFSVLMLIISKIISIHKYEGNLNNSSFLW